MGTPESSMLIGLFIVIDQPLNGEPPWKPTSIYGRIRFLAGSPGPGAPKTGLYQLRTLMSYAAYSFSGVKHLSSLLQHASHCAIPTIKTPVC